MESQTQPVLVELSNGATVLFETTVDDRASDENQDWSDEEKEEDVSRHLNQLNQVTEAIEGIAETVKQALEKVKPTKTSVEFGLELTSETGQLAAMVVKGSGKANLKITIEWS